MVLVWHECQRRTSDTMVRVVMVDRGTTVWRNVIRWLETPDAMSVSARPGWHAMVSRSDPRLTRWSEEVGVTNDRGSRNKNTPGGLVIRTLLSEIRECHDRQGVLIRTPQEVLRRTLPSELLSEIQECHDRQGVLIRTPQEVLIRTLPSEFRTWFVTLVTGPSIRRHRQLSLGP